MITRLRTQLKRLILIILTGVCFNSFAVAQKQYYSWDFSDCELKDILYAVSIDTGISIVPDDTVSGKGDLKFAGKDFSEAFDAFLNGCRLYVSKGEKVWTVSRFNFHEKNGFFDVDACDLLPVQIVEKLSEKIGRVITFETLPNQRISVHFHGLSEADLLESLCRRFGSYEIVRETFGYTFVKKNETRKVEYGNSSCLVVMNENGISLDLSNCYFEEVIEKLFKLRNDEKKSYCLLSNGEVKIQRAVFDSADLTDALEKVCKQSGFSFLRDGELYYFYADSNSKNELISGKRNWYEFSLNYIKSQDFFQYLFKRIGKTEVIEFSDKYSFMVYANESERKIITELISCTDIKQSTYMITLKYLKPDELLSNLPPTIDKEGLFLSADSKSVYFKGTEKAYENLMSELELCDQPKTRITYDLLILQYDETQQNVWSSNFDFKRLTANSRNNISGVLGSVMGFNLNVISAFGLNFALELQSSIEENNTRVFADTTLHGISGRQINFQNTNTYRYRDNNVNPETGVPIYSGVTREITSGIKLEILGWVSGNGMVTSKVTASVSRQGIDTSSSTGNPPTTSEKNVTTEVTGRSGEAVVLSGLILSSDSAQEKRTPFISKVPLIGKLFSNQTVIKEKTHMVIYLVPHVDGGDLSVKEKVYDSLWAFERIKKLEEIKKQKEVVEK